MPIEIMYDGMIIAITTQHSDATAGANSGITGKTINFARKTILDFLLAAPVNI